MNPGALALPLIAVLPIAAGSGRLPWRLAAAALAAALLALVSFLFDVPDPVWFASLPLWIVATIVTLRLGRHPEGAPAFTGEELEALRRRRSVLREAVTGAERDESRALQTYAAARALAEALSLEEMGPRLASAVQRLFDSFEFILYAVEEGRPMLLQRRGAWKNEPPVERFPDAETVIRPPSVAEIVPVLFVPIRSLDARVTGGLFVKVAPEPGHELEYVRIAAELGPQLGMALAKAMLFRQLELQSRFDGLTGTLRRQAFLDRLAEEFKRAAVFKTRFSVLMVDVDHFKAINDTRGHGAGDAVLARVGKILREAIYETDAVGRYGGEEFVVLLSRAETDGVMRKAEALRRRIEMERVATGFESLQVTVSIGVAHYPEAGATAERLIAAADQALYRAKESGRNRVVGS